MEEIRITRYLLIYGRSLTVKKDTKRRKKIRKRVRVVEKTDRDE